MGGTRRLVGAAGAALLSLVPVAACAQESERPGDRVDRATLVRDIGSQLSINTMRDRLRAVLVVKDGKPAFTQYYDSSRERSWDLGEVTQVIVSTLVGIALQEGRIGSLDDTLDHLLPDHAEDMSTELAATTLGRLLNHTSGLPGADHDRIGSYVTRRDPVRAILRGADRRPFRAFEYSPQGAHLVAAVLARATGGSVLDYARSRLFEPLGIDTERTGLAWRVDRSGLELGWTGLRMRPTDLAKLGRLYLDGGVWEGRRVVPASWVGRATSEQTLALDVDHGYGFGWWVRDGEPDPAYYAWGEGGQLLEVIPRRRMVVVVNGEVHQAPPGTDRPADLTFLVEHVIVPALTR